MKVKNCDRCGNDISISKPKEVREIKCGHCNMEYEVDKKTKYVSLAVMFVAIFLLAFFSVLFAEIINISSYILIIPLVIVSFYLSNLSYYFLAKLNKVTYKPLK